MEGLLDKFVELVNARNQAALGQEGASQEAAGATTSEGKDSSVLLDDATLLDR